jgi:YfiH family protein
LYDPIHQAIAAIHAGWRGTVARIVQKTIVAMNEAFDTEAENLKAIIGPGISQAAFEVGNEVYEAFQQAGSPMAEIATQYKTPQSSKWHIDLWAANFIQLEEVGLPLASIQVSGICTFTEHERFFSARRLGIESGRIFNGIMLR